MTTSSPPETNRSNIAKNTLVYLIAQSITWLVSFLYVSVIWRKMGEVSTGQLALAGTTTGTLFLVFSLGAETYLIKEVGRLREQSESIVGAILGLRIAMILPLTLLSVLALAIQRPSSILWQLGLLSMVACNLNLLLVPLRSILSGMEQARRVSVVDFCSVCAPLVAIPFLRYGPIALVLTSLVVLLCLLALQYRWVVQIMPLRPRFDAQLWRQVTVGGLPFFANTIILQLYGAAATFILRYMADEGAVGTMAAGNKLFGTLLFLPTAMSSALLPAMSRLAYTAPENLRRLQLRVLILLLVLALPVTTLVYFLADPLCYLLVGDNSFQGLPALLRMLGFVIIPVYLVSVMYQFLVAENKGAVWAWFLGGTAVLNAVLCLVLIPYTLRTQHNGAVGSALAALIAELCSVVAALWLLKINLFTWESVGRVGRALLATAGLAGVVWFLQHCLHFPHTRLGAIWATLLPAAAGLMVFGALTWALRVLSREEEQQIRTLILQKLRFRKRS